jgi:hypothetical protein
MKRINWFLSEVGAPLSARMEKALAGQESIIGKAGKPVGRTRSPGKSITATYSKGARLGSYNEPAVLRPPVWAVIERFQFGYSNARDPGHPDLMGNS